jgi:hypothetical protein
MLKITQLKLTVLTAGVFSASLIFILPVANANDDPFNMLVPISTYMLAENHGCGHGIKKMDTNGDGKLTTDEIKHGKNGKCNHHGEKKSSSEAEG